MTAILVFLDWVESLFRPVPPVETDDKCPYCHGLGYDSSGYTCICLRERR